MPNSTTLIIIGLIAAGVVIGAVVNWRRRLLRNRAWEEIAQRLRLSPLAAGEAPSASSGGSSVPPEAREAMRMAAQLLSPVQDSHNLAGAYRGRSVVLSQYTVVHQERRPGTSQTRSERKTYTTATTALRQSTSSQLRISPVIRLFSDVEDRTGDVVFDRKYEIKEQPAGLARRALASASLRQKLLALRGFNHVTAANAQVAYEQPGVVTSADKVQTLLDIVCDLADAMDAT